MNNYLYHHGIMGQKWGVRRYQNPDGSLTEEGRRRYNYNEYKLINRTGGKRGYASTYDRMIKYRDSSKAIQERSKELAEVGKKATKIKDQLEDYEDKVRYDDYNGIYSKAVKKAKEIASKDPGWDPSDPKAETKYNDCLVEYYLIDEDILDKTIDEAFKNDSHYKELKKEHNKAVKEYKNTCKKITNEIIGEYGDKKLTTITRFGDDDLKYKELVYNALVSASLGDENMVPVYFTHEEDLGRK